ncbi:hypothetical protein SLEP1_g54682 [Rubroshorea leprosula]|uniref:Uncharacterized protein n=1 Tax=Rubroshorea leprosula TaxID=152421 RepID=A0AAV5ME65_9ROSI|nr:hypothetical protein SLEP1_g54682 [Rubroshorea leprosula]
MKIFHVVRNLRAICGEAFHLAQKKKMKKEVGPYPSASF